MFGQSFATNTFCLPDPDFPTLCLTHFKFVAHTQKHQEQFDKISIKMFTLYLFRIPTQLLINIAQHLNNTFEAFQLYAIFSSFLDVPRSLLSFDTLNVLSTLSYVQFANAAFPAH